MTKAPGAFRTISEAADIIGVAPHVLRHWEDSFGAVRPMRRAGGRRYYREPDIHLLTGLKVLLHQEGLTTKGVRKVFAERGRDHIVALGRAALRGAGTPGPDVPLTVTPATVEALLSRLEGIGADIARLRRQYGDD